ncbi:hypothetical protein TrLO_g14275 [Triparma laevis f. longispina]|uniref:C2 domain-containing protein n=1 Tax=Triparma laevis f. longispina TaxID=1714387 RepID=A0A9W7C6A5_9STRA|nr:hypothetical protein TrLO_g14275 [Triparma laevis f. longispina]
MSSSPPPTNRSFDSLPFLNPVNPPSKSKLSRSTSDVGQVVESPRNRWAKTTARLISAVKKSPSPKRRQHPPQSPESHTVTSIASTAAIPLPCPPTQPSNISASYVYKRNKRFGYTKRFLAVDEDTGVFYYFSEGVEPTEVGGELTLDDLESSPHLKSKLLASEWTLSDAPDDPTGFFVFRGAGAANLQSKSGRQNSLFFKVLDPVEATEYISNMLMSKGDWIRISEKLSARGTDQFLHSHISIKGLANIEQVKRTRKITSPTTTKVTGSKTIKSTTQIEEQEHKVKPRRHYPNVWMTNDEMMKEVVKPTVQIQDTTVRNPGLKSIGKVEVEILQCFGLPKMDRFGKTDAYAIFVLGSSYFRSDTIDDNYSPIFLPKCRRAARFNITVPYEKLYVSVYDDDGSFASDDFIGRVEIDLSRLQPFLTYDVSLKLRDSDSIYSRNKPLGVVRLRIKITEWASDSTIIKSWMRNFFERKDGGQIVVTDKPMARQIANTCWGSEVPGEYSARLFKATIREFDLYEINSIHLAKKTIHELAFYESPILGPVKSLYVLAAWMWVAEDGVRALVVSALVFMIISLCENFSSRPAAQTPLGFKTAKLSKGVESLSAHSNRASLVISRSYSNSSLNSNSAAIGNITALGDFPFHNTTLYPEQGFDESLSRALKDKKMLSLLEQKASPFHREGTGTVGGDKLEDDDDEQEDAEDMTENHSFLLDRHLTSKKPVSENTRSTFNKFEKHIEQDEGKAGRSSSIINKFVKYRNRANNATGGMCVDKIFSYEGGGTCGGGEVATEATLKSQSSVNPVAAMKRKYMTPVQVGFKTAISLARALHAIATWKSTTITSIILSALIILTLIAYVFPFNLLFKAVGIAFVGPQNYVFSHLTHQRLLREQSQAASEAQLKRTNSEASTSTTKSNSNKIKKIFSKSSDGGWDTDDKKDKGLKKLIVHLPRRNFFDCSRFNDDTNLFEASKFYG